MLSIGQNRVRRALLLGLSLFLFRSSVNPTCAYSQAGSVAPIAILQAQDPLPADAEKLLQRSLRGSNNGDCAYYELLMQAEDLAAEAGANLLKIISRSNHSRTQPCDGLEVALYRTASPRQAEKTFRWDGTRRLTWEDFKGPIRAGSADRTAAETSCGIAVETSLVSSGGKARIYVFNTFEKHASWVRPGKEQDGILEHEQGHWDICELYTRKMQDRFDRTHITGATLNRMVNQIYNEVSREYIERQEQYEEETQHGVVEEAQRRWTLQIAKELNREMTGRL